jgi:hypothetical protein
LVAGKISTGIETSANLICPRHEGRAAIWVPSLRSEADSIDEQATRSGSPRSDYLRTPHPKRPSPASGFHETVKTGTRTKPMEVDIIISLGIAAVILFSIAQLSRILRSRAMHKTLRKAIEQGQTLDPALIERLDRAPEPGVADQRIGLVLVALALALVAAGLINPGEDNYRQLWTIALFPLFVGIALLARPWLAKRSRGA